MFYHEVSPVMPSRVYVGDRFIKADYLGVEDFAVAFIGQRT
jgi:hypothetical protein